MGVKSFITSRVKRSGKWILNNSTLSRKLFRRVLTSDYATRMLIDDGVALIDIMSHPAYGHTDSVVILEQFLLEKALLNPKHHPRMVDWISSHSSLVKTLLSKSQFKHINLREPDYLSHLIAHHDLYEELIDPSILQEIFQYEETLECILEHYVLRERLLFDERVLDRMIADPRYQEELFAREDVVQHLLEDKRLLQAVLKNSEMLGELIQHPSAIKAIVDNKARREAFLDSMNPDHLLTHIGAEAMLEHLASEVLLEHLGVEALLGHLGTDVMLNHLGTQEMLNHLDTGALLDHLDSEVMLKHLGSDEMLNHLSPEVIFKHLGDEMLLGHLDSNVMLNHLGSKTMLTHLGPEAILKSLDSESMLNHLGSETMLKYLGPEAMLKSLGSESMLNHLGSETMLKYLGPEAMLKSLGPESMLNHLGSETMLMYLGPEAMLKNLGPETMLKHLGTESMLQRIDDTAMLEYLGDERLAQHLGQEGLFAALNYSELVQRVDIDSLLEEIDPEGGRIASYLADHPKVIMAISRHQEALEHLLQTSEIRNNLTMLDGVERSTSLPYSLPAAVVCYPRSGSNFLQSILLHSSGMQNISIYAKNPSSFVPLLTVKSHALSPDYLQDEYARLLETESTPGRILLLKRDPRDVMISFYEYTQVQRETNISQQEFLEEICFFYASTIDKTNSRNLDKAPMSVLDAYKKHVKEWFSDRPKDLPVLEVRYEDMVTQPQETFRAALDYLALDVPVAEAYFEVKVSLYSEEKRARGVAYSWKTTQDSYATLLEGVERLLAEEIKVLGYTDMTPTKKTPANKKKASTPTKRKKRAKKKVSEGSAK